MHIELTEMLRCPETHPEELLVLSTGEMLGRMVRSGLVGCPVCRREYPIVDGVVYFGPAAPPTAPSPLPAPRSPLPAPDAQTIQALLELSGPGGFVVLVGAATRYAVGLAALMAGIHFIGINPPSDAEEFPVLSLLRSDRGIPLRGSVARGAVVGTDAVAEPWLLEAQRVLLRGRRMVVEGRGVTLPPGLDQLAAADALVVGVRL
jgi:uncharacterized protein YbaR (Trm112 family)